MVGYREDNKYESERLRMINKDLRGRDITDMRVLKAMAEIPRQNFVNEKYAFQAYEDNPLPIGMGQTISQPYIVALMTQCLELTGTETVLEIGTGSGYQTAILARLAESVYTVERFCELSAMAQSTLGDLDIENVQYAVSDGSCGWPNPDMDFDRIIVTAAVPEVPEPMAEQLLEGGLLVAPVGGQLTQTLTVFTKMGGKLRESPVCGVRFVNLVGKYGFPE